MARHARDAHRFLVRRVVGEAGAVLEVGESLLRIGRDEVAVRHAVEHREAAEVRFLHAAAGVAHLGAELLQQPGEGRDRGLRIVGRRDEGHFRDGSARPNVDRVLVREDRAELLDHRSERETQRRDARQLRGADSLEGEERERSRRHLLHELRRVRLQRLAARALQRAVELETVVGRDELGRSRLEARQHLRQVRRCHRTRRFRQGGDDLRAVRVRLHERVVGERRHRVLEGRVIGQLRAGRRLLERVDRRLRVGEHGPSADFGRHGGVAAVRRVELLDERVELRLVRRLRQPHHVGLRSEHGDVDLLAERGLDVRIPVRLRVLLERRADLGEQLVLPRELVQQAVDGLPLRRGEVGVDRDVRERVGGYHGRAVGAPRRAGRGGSAPRRGEREGEQGCSRPGPDPSSRHLLTPPSAACASGLTLAPRGLAPRERRTHLP